MKSRFKSATADSGAAVTNAALHTQFVMRPGGQYLQNPRDVRPDAAGRVTLPLSVDQPLLVTVNAPGYELIDQRFERLSAGQTLEMKLRPGSILAGRVVDKATGEGIPGASLRVIHEKGPTEMHYQWTDALRLLARTDADGRFTVNQLRHNTKYAIGVSAPGHESVLLDAAAAGAKDLLVKLGPELIVSGHVIGSLDSLQQNGGHSALYRSFSEVFDNSSRGDFEWVRVRVTNGVATFQFTNRVAGPMTLSGGGYREQREVTAPIEDWVVDLAEPGKKQEKTVPKREVVFRFQHPSGVPPQGTVQVEIPDNLEKNHLTAHSVEMEITNGEVHVEIPIGGQTSLEPKQMVGYWFNHWKIGNNGGMWVAVTNGPGPQVIEIPLLPAGAIYAKARNSDGTPAGGMMFGVGELIRAPGRDESSLSGGGDSFSDDAPRNWVSGPLPLGGTYQVHAWRGNLFCVSKPVKLTEANPDAEIELQFPPARLATAWCWTRMESRCAMPC